MSHNDSIVVIGSGTMGSGIAELAASCGHNTLLYDPSPDALKNSETRISQNLQKLCQREKITESEKQNTLSRLQFIQSLEGFSLERGLVIEAIVENLQIKQELFRKLEESCSQNVIFSTNTSSLSVGAIFSKLQSPERGLGLHFFNPAPRMPLVEIVAALRSSKENISYCYQLMNKWNKKPVITKDLPGFIVNRLARPYYAESLRIVEEGYASASQMDTLLKDIGGFKMGPFELMDLIGLDVNYAVTCSVFESFYYDPRYRPSLLQKSMVDAGYFGRKTGRGFYSYNADGSVAIEKPLESISKSLQEKLFLRVLSMLVNEACEALHLQLAEAEDLETAMRYGVNYPQGLLSWGDSIGAQRVLETLESLYELYGDMRYRPSIYLKEKVNEGGLLLNKSSGV